MKALITGVTGQDGHYLSEFLSQQGYEVYGIVRRTSSVPNIPENVITIESDVIDPGIVQVIEEIKPDEVYNLAGQSYVWESFKVPQATFEINTFGAMNVLEGARRVGAKYYQASTSEMFGSAPAPQNEKTPFRPRSPYGVAKLAAHWLTINYREAYGMFACNGILFNHESPLRGHVFLSKKVASYCYALRTYGRDMPHKLKLGNLAAKRDWGHAKDYVRGMHLMMQLDKPRDLVFATGETHTVKEFVETAFEYVGHDWEEFVEIDPKLFRPTEVDVLQGDPAEAFKLGWKPEYSFQQLIYEMIDE
jgi:GDPmannose 4,6-dehydratase